MKYFLASSLVFFTREDAEAYTLQKGTPCPVSFDGEEIPFTWTIREEEIEHREKYSMGAGYYLSGSGSYSGWHVEKHVFYKGGPQRADYICLAQRHDHLTGNKPEPKPTTPKTPSATPAPSTPNAAGYELTYERDWTWIKFPAKPAESILAALHAANGHWSKRREAWYFTRHLESGEVEAITGGQSSAPASDGIETVIPAQIFLSTETPCWEE